MNPDVPTRRKLLAQTCCGFGGLALNAMQMSASHSSDAVSASPSRESMAAQPAMFAPRAKRIIFVFMQGGPSHVDTFDLKPELVSRDGQSIDFTGVRFGDFGQVTRQKLMKPLWRFTRHGQTGKAVSELFPHIAGYVDDLCFLHGVHTEGVAHGPSTLFLHTGATTLVRPSIGSWILYGLGTENQSLPGFVSLQPSDANGGPRNYSNAFLPAICQGTSIGRSFQSASEMTIDHIRNTELTPEQTERRYSLTQQMNRTQAERSNHADDEMEAVIRNYELAWRMQAQAPEILDLSGESAATAQRYGIGEKETDEFGKQCLLARRLSESGVRFVQVNYSDQSPNPRWDQHSNMPQHAIHAKATDKPVAGLLEDLKQRGLLEDTIVWWGGEFGRTPFSQGSDGRDHNPRGFTVFLAGGGFKPGFSWGATDEIGHLAVEGKVHMHDLHATLLHQLGINHEQLTFEHAGRNFRPTDVYGRVVPEILQG
ncbi:MAG: DUF1501 domain-containing protein [Planctomycetota bacterium]|nr:MAG: DUF1501 domain-containing protein [Planctomycetota bacterium]